MFDENNIDIAGEAANISDGLDLIIKHKPGYVILDLQMPGGSGFSLLNYLKEQNVQTKVIILTNFSDGLYRSQAKTLGADYFFDKSTEFDRVLEVIKTENSVR
jgi:DNA-binding NarL/FixJ family response regulator